MYINNELKRMKGNLSALAFLFKSSDFLNASESDPCNVDPVPNLQ